MIIGVTGKARSGKDTFSKFFAESLFDATGRRFILMAYAHELKKRVQRDFDLSYEQLWGDEKESPDERYRKYDTKPYSSCLGNPKLPSGYWTAREILQAYGQFFRTIDYNFWVKELFRTISENEFENVIVTDVRHPNEADPIRDSGGYIIKVTRDNKQKIHGDQHISEIAMDDYQADFNISNDYELDGLKRMADDTVVTMLKLEQLKNLEANNG